MIRYVCDWCQRVKLPEETWVLGHAAEALGLVSARREVTILSRWDRDGAVDPLAVHFCSIDCKDKYMAEVFSPDATSVELVVERAGPAEVIVERRSPVRKGVSKIKRQKASRNKRAA
jgi:hypothetical protein